MKAMKSNYVAPATAEVLILGRNAFMQEGLLEASTPVGDSEIWGDAPVRGDGRFSTINL